MARNKTKLSYIAEALNQAERLVLLTHISPDVDGLGSMLSLARALEEKEKKVTRFLSEPLPKDFPFLYDTDKVTISADWKSADMVVALDCGEIKRTGVANQLQDLDIPLVNIDHHPQPNPFGEISFVDHKRSSTAEIVYHLLGEMNVEIDKSLADMLLAGIVCDTQGFQVASTSAEVLQISSALMRRGARMPIIAKDLFRVKPITALKLWGRVLDRMRVDGGTGMVYSVVKQKDFKELDARPHDLEGVVDLINSVSEGRFSMLLSEDGDNVVKGSLRSEEFKKIDVSKIAELFGGGGHKLASGFRTKGKLEEKEGKWVIKK